MLKGAIIYYIMCAIYDKEKSQPLEDVLSKFLGAHRLAFSDDTDIVGACKKLGLTVQYMPLDKEIDGMILVNDKYSIIAIKNSLSPIDKRFLIAHELAHFITAKYDYIAAEGKPFQFKIAAKDKLRHGKEKPKSEHDMDYLAAAILVPFEQFKRELDATGVSYAELHTETDVFAKIPLIVDTFARRYRVSPQLIARRVSEVSYYV